MAVKSCKIYVQFLKHLQTCQSQTITSEPLVSTLYEAWVKNCLETLTRHSSLHRMCDAGKKHPTYTCSVILLLALPFAQRDLQIRMFDSQSIAVMAKLLEKCLLQY